MSYSKNLLIKSREKKMLLPQVPNNCPVVSFANNFNERSSKAIISLKESLCEFSPTIWNDVYIRYKTKLWVEKGTVSHFDNDNKSGGKYTKCLDILSRRIKSDRKSSRSHCEPYYGPPRHTNENKRKTNRDKRGHNQNTSVRSSLTRKE